MRVLIDSSVLVSAIYSPSSISHQAYKKAVESPYQGLVCTFTLDELRRVFNKKLPHLESHLERFLDEIDPVVEIVPVPPFAYAVEDNIRDAKDRPILRAAINAGTDILHSAETGILRLSSS